MDNSTNNILISKLDEFIRKYYKNQLVKGLLYSSALLISAFIGVILLDYAVEFDILARSILFYAFVGTSLFVLIKYITIPLLKLYRFGSIISYEEAASIIGTHFTNVQDKLLNVLQLQGEKGLSGSNDLLLAGINQKITELKPVPFTSAIDLTENKKYLRYVLPPLFLTVGIAVIWPHIIAKSTKRLVHHQTYYAKEAPFQFNIENNELKAVQQQDFVLKLKLTGEEIPNDVFININGNEFKLEKENNINFSYTFKNVQASEDFQLSAAGFTSNEYKLEVLPKPSLAQFQIQLTYPNYLNRKDEVISNTGDLQIPQGTEVKWQFNTKNADKLLMVFDNSSQTLLTSENNNFSFSKKLMQPTNYYIKTSNPFVLTYGDSVNYNINVISDAVPSIDVSEKQDSVNHKNIYFSGSIKDDYGFSKLVFHYTHFAKDSSGQVKPESGERIIGINKSQISQPYFHYFDASQFNINPGDKIEYYFEVWDNDGVNGSKSSRTKVMQFKAPTMDEMNEEASKNNKEIEKDLEESIKKAKQLQKDMNDLSKKMNDKKQLGWEEKKKIEDILAKQKELENKVNEVKQENQMNNQMQNEFSQPDESILEKQKQLEQLFENVMTPEMKKLFDDLQKMMDQLDKNQVQQKLEEMKLNNKDIEKELDRALESFKQWEVEQKMQQAIDKLDELSKKEDQLNEQTENKDADKKPSDSEELKNKQDELNKEFDQLKEDMKEIEQKNSELEQPNALPNTEEQKKEIGQEMQNSSEQLSKDNKKSASKSQKSASQKMKEMKEQMESAMEAGEEEQEAENMEALRQILENLLNLSFSQEDLIKQLPKTRVDNPQYTKIPQQQKKLQDDSKVIEDSLFALSKRAPQIEALVNREISAINSNMQKTVQALAERMPGEAAMRMQSSMTSINNLALLLNESLEQMQKQAQNKSQGQGGGKCKKPGKGSGNKPSPQPGQPKLSQLQQQLNQQLKDLKDALEKGQKPGEKPGQGQKPGQKPGSGMGMGQGQQNPNGMQMPGMSEQLAKMAAQQEALRREIQKMMDQMKNKGQNPGGNLAELMEQTEKDIVNKSITNETMKRQQDILTRLLESEKAEREREQDEKRKSNEAKNQDLSNPNQFLEYKRIKEKEMELLNTVPPSLTPFYKEKVNNYFNSVSK